MRNAIALRPSPASVVAFVLVAAASLHGGCKAEAQSPSSEGIAIESLREEIESAECERRVRCGFMPDAATCRELLSLPAFFMQLLADVVYGAVEYDGSAAQSCVGALRAGECDGLAPALSDVEACREMFRGSTKVGDACLADGECEDGAFCDRSLCDGEDACCGGVCSREPVRAAIGEDCSQRACVEGAYCDEGGEDGDDALPRCRARRDNGEDCTSSRECKDGQRCSGEGEEGKCYILAKVGERCNPDLDVACRSLDAWCDPATSTCVRLPGAGEPCADGDRCLDYAYCDRGTCKVRPGEGGLCPEGGPPCLGDLRCEGETCTPPPPVTVCVPDHADE